MKSTIEIIVQLGGVALIFAAVWAFVRFTGYGEFYDKMMYDEESDDYITIKKGKDIKDDEDNIIHHVSDEDDIIHHVSIKKKRIQNGNKTFNGNNN